MCDPVSMGIAAAAGAAASIGGTILSSRASSQQASAIQAQNQALNNAQNQAFTQRLNAGYAQTAAQTAASSQTLSDRAAAANNMRAQQMDALKNYQDTINAQNAQAETLRQTGDTAAQQLVQQTDPQALAAAQQQQQAQASTLLNQQGPQTSNPSTGDPATNAAIARRTAEAATNIRNYGSKIATVSSYDAPMRAVNLAIQANKGQIMPAQQAEQLLRSGSATRLLPTQLEYTGATATGNAADALISSRGQNALDAASLVYGNTTDIANLRQSNADVLAKNTLDQTTANLAAQKANAGIISGLGNLGLYGAGYFAGGGTNPLKSIFGSGFPSTDAIIAKGGT